MISSSRLTPQNKITGRQPLPLSEYQPRIRIKAGDNLLIPGRKGSGKTTFIKSFIPHYIQLYPTSRIYTLDVKFRDYNDWPGSVTSEDCPAAPDSNERFQTWHCLSDSPEEIEKWLYRVLHDPPAFLNIDEGLALCYGSRDTSPMFKKIQKLGRDLPIGTGFSTQELVQIPRNAIGQVDHAIRFKLKHPYEVALMNNIMGMSKGQATHPEKYSFWYQHADSDDSPLYFTNVQNFLNLPSIQ